MNKNAFSWCNRALEEQLKQIGKKLKSESKHLGSEGFVKIKVITMFACTLALLRTIYRAFSLTWPASMQIDWNKRKPLPGLFRTTTSVGWTSFQCFGTPVSLAAMTSRENVRHNAKPSLLKDIKKTACTHSCKYVKLQYSAIHFHLFR